MRVRPGESQLYTHAAKNVQDAQKQPRFQFEQISAPLQVDFSTHSIENERKIMKITSLDPVSEISVTKGFHLSPRQRRRKRRCRAEAGRTTSAESGAEGRKMLCVQMRTAAAGPAGEGRWVSSVRGERGLRYISRSAPCSHRTHAMRTLSSPARAVLFAPADLLRVPRKCVRVPSRSRTHARLYTKIDTPSERDCPIPPAFPCGGPWEATAALVMRESAGLNRLNRTAACHCALPPPLLLVRARL
jgi:hypothetical protein